jgi:hypothetical protein
VRCVAKRTNPNLRSCPKSGCGGAGAKKGPPFWVARNRIGGKGEWRIESARNRLQKMRTTPSTCRRPTPCASSTISTLSYRPPGSAGEADPAELSAHHRRPQVPCPSARNVLQSAVAGRVRQQAGAPRFFEPNSFTGLNMADPFMGGGTMASHRNMMARTQQRLSIGWRFEGEPWSGRRGVDHR